MAITSPRHTKINGPRREIAATIVKCASRCIRCAALVALGMVASTVFAQSEPGGYGEPPGPFHQPVPPYPVEMGFSQDHSSTFAEGWARGRAALIQAHGNYELSRAQAGVIYEQGRWINRINDLEQTRALYTQQEMWRTNRERERQLREQRSAAGAESLAQRERTLYHPIYRLSADQLDRETGAINWTGALAGEQYREYRERLNELFREQLAYGSPTAATAEQIARCTTHFKRALQQDVRDLPRDEYLAAQRFLLGLKYGAQHQVQVS